MLKKINLNEFNEKFDLLFSAFQTIEKTQEQQLLEDSFHAFIKAAWHAVEGSKPFIDNWSLGAICEHLEAAHRLEIRKLIINVPPRSSKSTIATIMWPVWTWIDKPWLQYFCVSHSDKLVKKHAVQSRDIIMSSWFKERWGNIFSIKQDQNTQNRYVNSKLGYRESCGILSKFTGSGGLRIIIDDPNDAQEYASQREKVNEKYSAGLSTRINNPNESVWVLIQQRTNEKDLTGHVENEDDWVKLILPMEFETARRAKTIVLPSTNGKVWQDPRKVDGELLWPERFDKNEVEKLKVKLGSYHYAGQYQQRPAPEGGEILKAEWFKWYKKNYYPKLLHIIQSWDTAMSDNDSACYSACTTWGVFQDETKKDVNNILLLSLWRGKVQYPELRKIARRLYQHYLNIPPLNKPYNKQFSPDVVLVENKTSGVSLVQDLRQAGVNAVAFNPNKYGDKVARVRFVSHLIEAGQVWLIAEPPKFERLKNNAELLLQESAVFPNGEYRDLVDTMSQVLIRLKENGILRNPADASLEFDD